MAESIDIKLEVDASEAEELNRLPREVQREWERLQHIENLERDRWQETLELMEQ